MRNVSHIGLDEDYLTPPMFRADTDDTAYCTHHAKVLQQYQLNRKVPLFQSSSFAHEKPNITL